MDFCFPVHLRKLSLWSIACRLTTQNATDDEPNNDTLDKLAKLVQAIFAGRLWVEWKPGIDVDFIQGFLPRAAEAEVRNDWKSLDAVTIRCEDWERFTAQLPAFPPQPAPASAPMTSAVTHTNDTLKDVGEAIAMMGIVVLAVEVAKAEALNFLQKSPTTGKLVERLAMLQGKSAQASSQSSALPISVLQPAPASEPVTPVAVLVLPPAAALLAIRHKIRKNSIDVPIKKAVKAANSLATGAVYLELREMALNCEKPFTGAFVSDALLYTKDDNITVAQLTKNALGKRLKYHTL